MPGKLSVHVVSDVDDDVLAGLELYRSMAHPDLGPEIVKDWLYWFEENPFGRPSIALASLDGEVVGMYSLIPSKASLGGETVPAAKGEFFAVKPECTLLIDPQSGHRLPLALPGLARREAVRNGAVLTFGIPAMGTLLSGQLTGAGPISWDTLTFVAPARLFSNEKGNPIRTAMIAGTFTAGHLLRAIRQLRIASGAANFTVCRVDDFERVLPSTERTGNQLFADDVDLVNFRFPRSHYWKYTLSREGEEVAQFVFTAATRGTNTSLKYWSSLPDLDQGLEALLLQVIRETGRKGADAVRIEVPVTESGTCRDLKRIGFVPRGRLSRLALTWCATESLTKIRDERQWALTNAHSGWYQLS